MYVVGGPGRHSAAVNYALTTTERWSLLVEEGTYFEHALLRLEL